MFRLQYFFFKQHFLILTASHGMDQVTFFDDLIKNRALKKYYEQQCRSLVDKQCKTCGISVALLRGFPVIIHFALVCVRRGHVQ